MPSDEPQAPIARTFHIGVDTGGTYTDAAIIEASTGAVVASAKALTTRGDYAIGVTGAIEAAMSGAPDAFSPGKVGLVCVSTTLATNAVVEGHGDQVGVIMAGFDAAMVAKTGIAASFPGMPVIVIGGGHDHNGDEAQALDEDALIAAIAEHGGKAAAFAVASRFAVRNPAHEHRIRDIVSAATGKPVTLSVELSNALDAPRRALTAALNARLIARISALIAAVERSLKRFEIDCPLMIVKGDGTLALADNVALRPIETVLSGPAASMVGAARLSGLGDFIMSDMGGTTTDLGVMHNGRPVVTDAGAEVGGWRTMVRAIDVRTVGLGGDSEVHLSLTGGLSVGPGRVVPVSLLGAEHEGVLMRLEADLADAYSGSAGRFAMLPAGTEPGWAPPSGLNRREAEMFGQLTNKPQALSRIAGSSSLQSTLKGLHRKGLIQVAGFTPSDAAHVLGLQDNWSRAAAVLAAKLMLRQRGTSLTEANAVDNFAREVFDETVRRSGVVVLETALGPAIGAGDRRLIDQVASGRSRAGLAEVRITPSVPIVAVGGPVGVYYPEMADRLGARAVFAENCDVANAVGAASGVIARSVTVIVNGDGSGLFRVHGAGETMRFGEAATALSWAEQAARDAASAEAVAMGADNPDVRVAITRQMLPDAVDDNGLLEARVTAEAVGRPA